MFKQGKLGSLNQNEKRIVKYLCNKGWTNQNIQDIDKSMSASDREFW